MLDKIFEKFFGRRDTSAPLLIGATGGSGTRALHGALGEAGFFVGTRLNHAGDAMDFEPFLDEIINPILRETRSLDYALDQLSDRIRESAVSGFKAALKTYTAELPQKAGHWGWKNPRSMYILPIIAAACPDMIGRMYMLRGFFQHLVRDGRDMALSDNQNQPNKHYEALFGDAYEGAAPECAIRHWATANTQVADWGERELGSRYMRVRFEDLCAAPGAVLSDALIQGGIEPAISDRVCAGAESVIRAPSSIGRWHNISGEDARALTEKAAVSLERFGYQS